MNVATISQSDELKDLYRELILDHSRNPRNFGKLADATHVAEGINPLCGDKLKLYLRVDANDAISAVSFEGTGCAISVASASLLTEAVIGQQRDYAGKLFSAINARLTGTAPEPTADMPIEKMRALDGVREFPARVKCATLAWQALNSALAQQTTPVSTE